MENILENDESENNQSNYMEGLIDEKICKYDELGVKEFKK